MRRLLRLPGGPVGCLGLAGLRGKMVPVFDLAAVLGASAASPPGWLVVTQGEPPVAWAFDALDRLVHVPADAVRPAAGSVAGLTHTVAIDGVAHAVLNLPTLVATLVPRADAPGPSKEFSS
jgi:purine-binding chemotaxis protein CheW